ncbi:winged helix-turn-helix transcriptional regulator [Actinomadura livida]|uniref:DNA-binding HxlR family transcriptional regulator n=1 Tax=Actinomadura livida TaxID=79909 RepID=A0A7W7MXF8_9ACTN|nr:MULTISPECIES: helix-turn-helix domain-containing protein [Actinomadura]MBB4774786.1 DNA-binding HxlR family transcriptional regulator [Actinomadura catellatispora]GGU06001.1 HxlR family transcriptional regulator [Actinomadura livida]
MKQHRRNYGQYCGLAAGLDIVGERWTLLIVRELLAGPCRYNELLANLPGIGTNLLADRLKFLTSCGIVRQRPRAGSKLRVYELTEQGEGLRETVLALARWGLGTLDEPLPGDIVRPRWAALAIEAMIQRDMAGPDEQYEFRIGDEVFHVQVLDGGATVVHGKATTEPALVLTTDSVTFVKIGAGLLNPLEATLTNRLVLDGAEDAIIRCSRLLGLMA